MSELFQIEFDPDANKQAQLKRFLDYGLIKLHIDNANGFGIDKGWTLSVIKKDNETLWVFPSFDLGA